VLPTKTIRDRESLAAHVTFPFLMSHADPILGSREDACIPQMGYFSLKGMPLATVAGYKGGCCGTLTPSAKEERAGRHSVPALRDAPLYEPLAYFIWK
jgi:hypothetical protein